MKNNSSGFAVAVGGDALRALAAAKAQISVVTTMCFREDLKIVGFPPAGIRLAGALWLDLGIAQLAGGLRMAFPEARRIALLRNPSQGDPAGASARPHPLPSGMNVTVVDCAGPADLLPALGKLRGQVEFVVCLPDSSLYNQTTVEPLILASLEHRLPLVGFSASFVRAGAAVGVYPDFTDIGLQTAILAQRCQTEGADSPEEYPRRTIVAANERVLHLLGREFRAREHAEVVLVR